MICPHRQATCNHPHDCGPDYCHLEHWSICASMPVMRCLPLEGELDRIGLCLIEESP